MDPNDVMNEVERLIRKADLAEGSGAYLILKRRAWRAIQTMAPLMEDEESAGAMVLRDLPVAVILNSQPGADVQLVVPVA